jgi:hypothetical protein
MVSRDLCFEECGQCGACRIPVLSATPWLRDCHAAWIESGNTETGVMEMERHGGAESRMGGAARLETRLAAYQKPHVIASDNHTDAISMLYLLAR